MWLLLLLMLRLDGVEPGGKGQIMDLSLDGHFNNASDGQFKTFIKSLEKCSSEEHIE
jgi:hypothetical protein